MNPDFSKGLLPVIIQDDQTLEVLMLGYMNDEAFEMTIKTGFVTFFSRSKKRLWTKGEQSGNYLKLCSIHEDCDNDTILIRVRPAGPACHKGNISCFNANDERGFIYKLEKIISDRIAAADESSYTSQLFQQGIRKVAQKVGEESFELVIDSLSGSNDQFKEEAADLLYHLLLLIRAKGEDLYAIEKVLAARHKARL